MVASSTGPFSVRRAALLATFALILVATSAVVVRAGAPTPAAPAEVSPYAEFQNSTLTGTTSTINVSNLPVVTSTGSVLYDNVTITFKVSSSGVLSVASTKVVAAPQVDTDGFEAGNYIGPSNDTNYLLTVSGPGVGTGGITEWSLQASSGASSGTYPSTATWYVGPLNSSNPLYTRLQMDGITSTAYSYGTGGGGSNAWPNCSLLGFAQTGSGLTIVNFTDLNCIDHNTQQATITYTPVQP